MIGRALYPIWREAKLAYYQRAMREINKLHPDVGSIALAINRLKAERRAPCSRTNV